MAVWTSSELDAIGNAEELDIAGRLEDGTLRKPTTIWVVRVGDDLYVRSVDGRTSKWFSGTQVRGEGHIEAGGVGKDVTFVDVSPDDPINPQIDAEYWNKYPQYPEWVPPTLTPAAKSAGLKLVPR